MLHRVFELEDRHRDKKKEFQLKSRLAEKNYIPRLHWDSFNSITYIIIIITLPWATFLHNTLAINTRHLHNALYLKAAQV